VAEGQPIDLNFAPRVAPQAIDAPRAESPAAGALTVGLEAEK
jgi:hypothetical protein